MNRRNGSLAPVVALALLPCQIAAASTGGTLPLRAGEEPRSAEQPKTPEQIVAAINEQAHAQTLEQRFVLTTTERSGRALRRSFVTVRADDQSADAATTTRRAVAAIVEPRLLRGTKLLTWDYPDARDDDQWLYTRADGRSRRIAAGRRGDAFFGSAFSYDDIKNAQRLDLASYEWRRLHDAGSELELTDPGCVRPRCFVLEYRPKTEKLAKALRFHRAVMVVDAERLVGLRWDFFDVRDELFKRIEASDIRRVDGIWTPHRFVAELLRSQRRSEIVLDSVEYGVAVDHQLLTREGLGRELR